MAQLVKNLPAVQETWILSLGWEDPLEKGKATQVQYSGLENSISQSLYILLLKLYLSEHILYKQHKAISS